METLRKKKQTLQPFSVYNVHAIIMKLGLISFNLHVYAPFHYVSMASFQGMETLRQKPQ